MKRFSGVYAALLAPRDEAGELDLDGIRQQVERIAMSAPSGFALNGATGEFTFATETELAAMLHAARQTVPTMQILAGIGANDVRGAVLRGHIAAENGAEAVLLPMPAFFPYRQDDLRAFVLAVADAVPLPVLLYNLPQFTTGLQVETTLSLLQSHENIVGIKDSSGSLETMRAITGAKLEAARIIGNDSALCGALKENVCDAVVSGVACALPELMTRIFEAAPGSEVFRDGCALLEEFIQRIGSLPTPWGLKVASEARGFTRASYPFPLSPEREEEVATLRRWLEEWLKKTAQGTQSS